MSRTRHDAERSIGQRRLEKQTGFETRRVLIADNEQDRTVKTAQSVREMPQRWPRGEHAPQRHRHPDHRMLCQAFRKTQPGGLVLGAQALRIVASGEISGKSSHADRFGVICVAF